MSGDCWLWTGAATTSGYGSLTRNYVRQYPHRLVFEAHHGALAEGECVCHVCDVRLCVNPVHMFRGTKGDNVRDASGKDRISHGVRHVHAKLTEQDVIEIRDAYAAGDVSQSDLASRFGVSQMAISKVVRGMTWRRVTRPA